VKTLDEQKTHFLAMVFAKERDQNPLGTCESFENILRNSKYGKTKENFGRAVCEPFLFCLFFLGSNFIYPWSKWHFASICEVCESFVLGSNFICP
jgi:hypothetical protein